MIAFKVDKELSLREVGIIEKECSLEMKLKVFQEQCRDVVTVDKEMDAKSKETEVNAKLVNESYTFSEVSTKELHPEKCDEIRQLCRNMDAVALSSYLIEHFKESKELLIKFSDSLRLARDPAKLVFDVIRKLYEIMDSDNVLKQIYTLCCCVLPKELLKLKVIITPHLKDAARDFSNLWKGCLCSQGGSALEIYGFLQFLASYKIAESYDADELLKFVGAFYTETEVLWPEKGSYLCRILGLMDSIPGQIRSLIKRGTTTCSCIYMCF